MSARRLLFAALGAGFQQLAEFLQLFLAQRLFNLFFGALIVDFAVVQLIRLLAGFSALAAGALKLLSVRWHTSTLNENSFSAAAARIFSFSSRGILMVSVDISLILKAFLQEDAFKLSHWRSGV